MKSKKLARLMLEDEQLLQTAEATIALSEGESSRKQRHDVDVLVTDQRILMFEERWTRPDWSQEYTYRQLDKSNEVGETGVELVAFKDEAQLTFSSSTERDRILDAIRSQASKVTPAPQTPEDISRAEERVAELAKQRDEGKLTQEEFDDQAIALLGLDTPPPT